MQPFYYSLYIVLYQLFHLKRSQYCNSVLLFNKYLSATYKFLSCPGNEEIKTIGIVPDHVDSVSAFVFLATIWWKHKNSERTIKQIVYSEACARED